MEKDRKELWSYLRTKKDPETEKPHTPLNYPEFKKKWYGSEKASNALYDYLKRKKLTKKSKQEFYEKYICDLSWAKSVSYCVSPDNSDFENWKKDHPESAGWVLYSDSDTCSKYWDTNKYQRDYKYNKGDKKTYCAIKNIGGDTSVAPSPGTSGYKECTDFYQLNCKDTGSSVGRPNTNGPIYKVQGCIGVKQDSFFGPKTQSALQAKIGKNYFTENQVEAICKGEVPGGTSPAIQMPLTQEDKVKYFEDLVDQKRIYINGILDDSNFDDVVYVVKYVDGKQTPLNSLNEIKKDGLKNEEYRILLFYAPVSLKEKGLWKDLVVVTEDWGEDVYDIIGNTRQTWEPNKAKPKIGLGENHLKSILKKVIKEQVLGGTNAPRPRQNTTTTTGGNTQQTQQGAQVTTTVTKPDPKVVQNTIDPIKEETISLLTSIQNMNTFKLGASQKDKSDLNDAITQLRNFDSSKACEGENINLIDDNLKLINNIIAQNKDKFGAGDIIKNLQGVKTNLEKVKSECNKLKASVQTTSGSGTKPTGDQTQQGGQNNQGQQSEDLYKLFGFVKPDGQSYNPTVKIEKLGKQALGESGTGTLQSAIDSSGARSYNFSKYNELVGSIGLGDEYKLKIPTNSPQNPGEVITKDNESILFPLEDSGSKQEFTQESFGKYLGTNSTAAIFISKRKTSTTMTSRRRCPFDKTGAREFLINYLSNGLTTLDSPRLEEKQTLCACRIDGTFDKLDPINKKDWEGIAKSEKPVNLFNQNLRWNDVVKLISGDKVAGETLNKNYQITNFMTDACGTTMRESISSSVKSHISEAINKKKKLTESIVNKITKKLI
jgi:hypothetical protein